MNNEKPILFGQQDAFAGETGKLILSKDWSLSSIGEIRSWPESLSLSVRLCLNAQFPAIIWWGRDFVQIYNDAFRNVLHIHLELLGVPGKENIRLWNSLGGSVQAVSEDGKAIQVRRKITYDLVGAPSEREFVFYHTPIVAASGTVEGVFTIVSESLHNTINSKPNSALELTEQRYFNMTAEVQDYAIILLDKDGTILNWNKGAQNIKGYKDDEIIWEELFYLLPCRRSQKQIT